MRKQIFENDHGGFWYLDFIEPHVKNTIRNEIKDLLTETANVKERIIKVESKMESQEDFERKSNERQNRWIAIITAIITFFVGIPGIISLIIQLFSKH